MPVESQRIYVGSIDCSKLSRFLSFDASPYSVATFEAAPQFNASLGSWVCKIQTAILGAPVDFPIAIQFTSSILRVADKDMTGTEKVFFTNTTVGTSGLVDIWAICKS